MKIYRYIFIIIFAFSNLPVNSQLPFKGPSFANDIIIHDKPERDQQNIVFASGFNGWLYSVYGHYSNDSCRITYLKSLDQGVTWNVLRDLAYLEKQNFIKLDLTTCGNTLDNLVYVRAALHYDDLMHWYSASVVGFDAQTDVGIAQLFDDVATKIFDISIASDNLYPASESIPSSIGYVYSRSVNLVYSIKCCISNNGTQSIDHFFTIASSPDEIFNNVDIAYARSFTKNMGKYACVWEEKKSTESPGGRIGYSIQNEGITSNFSAPVYLNDFYLPDPDISLSNPKIACQINDADNVTSDISTVILTEHYDSLAQLQSIIGFYTLRGSTVKDFQYFILTDSTKNSKSSDISFNTYDSTFIATYYDSTLNKLPYLVKNFNMNDPGNWTVLNEGVNDQNNLLNPLPVVQMCYGQYSGGLVWTGVNESENGVAYFDSRNHFPVAIDETHKNSIIVYPNPATDWLEIDNFNIKKIEIYSATGSKVLTFQNLDSKRINIKKLSKGFYYLIIIDQNNEFYSFKFLKI